MSIYHDYTGCADPDADPGFDRLAYTGPDDGYPYVIHGDIDWDALGLHIVDESETDEVDELASDVYDGDPLYDELLPAFHMESPIICQGNLVTIS